MVFLTVGTVIVARRPNNVIGWLCCAIGAVASFSGFGGSDAARSIAAGPDAIPGAPVLHLLGQVLYLVPMVGLLPACRRAGQGGLSPRHPPVARRRRVAAGDRRGVGAESPAGPPDHRRGRRADAAAVERAPTSTARTTGAVLLLWLHVPGVRAADRWAGGVHLRPVRGPGDPGVRRPGGRGLGGGADAAGGVGVGG